MKSKNTLLLLLTLTSLLFTSCEKWRCIKGNDNRTTETRDLGIFMGVVSEAEFEIYVAVDTSYDSPEVVVTADENLLSYIETKISGQDLYIETYDNRCLKSDRPIIINITTPDIDYIELAGSGIMSLDYVDRHQLDINLSGSGVIDVYDAFVDVLNVDHTGSGEVKLSGIAGSAEYNLDGSGKINGYNMEVNNCYVDLEGSGEVIVWAWDYLYVEIEGSGMVYYRSSLPTDWDFHIPGSGQVVRF